MRARRASFADCPERPQCFPYQPETYRVSFAQNGVGPRLTGTPRYAMVMTFSHNFAAHTPDRYEIKCV